MKTKRPFVWEEEAAARYPELTPCWNCVSHTKAKGYPHVNRDGRACQVSRLIFEELFGFIPEGHEVRHRCDNRACINPEHLLTGTKLDNMRDMRERGRSLKGEKQPTSKLTALQVKEIRERRWIVTQKELSRIFNVHKNTIWRIQNNLRWVE